MHEISEIPQRKNIPLLRKTLEGVTADPLQWTQRHWRDVTDVTVTNDQNVSFHCGSACCFAGHAALLNGARWTVPSGDIGNIKLVECVTVTDDEFESLKQHYGKDAFENRFTVSVSMYARWALGLTSLEAHDLFKARNTLDDLTNIVNRYIAEQEAIDVME